MNIQNQCKLIISYLKTQHPNCDLNKIVKVYSNISGIPEYQLNYIDAILGLLVYRYTPESILKIIL